MYNLGDIIEMCHGKWVEKYLVVFVGQWGEVRLKKTKLGRTKVSFLRFPEIIILKQVGKITIEPPLKFNNS